MNVPTSIVRALVRALWTKKLPKVRLSAEIPATARVTMVQKRREVEEYAINVVCEEWDVVPLGAHSPEIVLTIG